jgi:hypothetical protein
MAIDFQAARDPVCDGVEVLEAAVANTNSLWMFQVKEAGCKPALPGTPKKWDQLNCPDSVWTFGNAR